MYSAEHKRRYFEEWFNIFVYTMHVKGVKTTKDLTDFYCIDIF